MGWTHNWKRPTELSSDIFVRAVNDCRGVMAAIDVPLAGFDGTGEPIFNEDRVVFNGCHPNNAEPFEVVRVEFDRRGRSETWSFCKTDRYPYDLCVRAALIVFKHHLAECFHVGSDAGAADWQDALSVVAQVVGYGDGFQLDVPGRE